MVHKSTRAESVVPRQVIDNMFGAFRASQPTEALIKSHRRGIHFFRLLVFAVFPALVTWLVVALGGIEPGSTHAGDKLLAEHHNHCRANAATRMAFTPTQATQPGLAEATECLATGQFASTSEYCKVVRTVFVVSKLPLRENPLKRWPSTHSFATSLSDRSAPPITILCCTLII